MNTIKLTEAENGCLLPSMPDGTLIPCVVKDSMKIVFDDHNLQRGGYAKIELQYYVKVEDLPDYCKGKVNKV